MLKNRLNFIALCCALVLGATACGTDVEPERGASPQRGPVKADGFNSCEGICGGQALSGCWCDEQCAQFGDCCPDKGQACDGVVAPSCEGACGGQSAAGCWCDEQCARFGDCCSDKDEVCSAPAACTSLDESECAQRDDCEWVTTPGFPGDISMCQEKELPPPPPACTSLDESECAQRNDCEWTTVDGFPGPISMCVEQEQLFCADGEIFEKREFIDSSDGKRCEITVPQCLTNNWSQCPLFAPLPPDWCDDGTPKTVLNYTIKALDGNYCKIPKQYCLTKNWSNCPQFDAPPPGWCADGVIVQGEPSYVPAANEEGKYCELIGPVCLTADASACPQP